MLPHEYARAALKRGLAYEAKLGANPFKFGMIGSTDATPSLVDHARRTTSSASSPMREPAAERDQVSTR